MKVIDDFPTVYDDHGPNCLCFSEEVLAVGGRVGKLNENQVWLYLVKSDFDVLTTLEVPGKSVHSLAMSTSGTKFAVGMGGDGVAIYSSSDGWGDPPLRLADIHTEQQDVRSTAFSHDGRFLCAGYHPSNQFAICEAPDGPDRPAPDGPDRPSIEVRTTAFCAATEDEAAREEGRLPRGYTSRQSTTW